MTGRRHGTGEGRPGLIAKCCQAGPSGALMNILMSMCLGFIVLALALLVFWGAVAV